MRLASSHIRACWWERPTWTYDTGRENISVATGNLNLQIPIVHLPGRNGHNLDVSLTYNSQNWTPVQSSMALGSLGWQLSVPVLYATGVTTFSNGSSGPPPYGSSFQVTSCWANLVVAMGDGTKYSFPAGNLLCQQQQTTCGSSGTSTNCTTDNNVPFPYADYLIPCDSGSETGTGAGCQGRSKTRPRRRSKTSPGHEVG
jgi:hypothetical protein